MADLLALEVVTPERLLVREEVATVQAPAKNGYLGVLPGHAPLLAELGTGFLYYEGGGGRHYMAVHGGFLEVLQDRVRVLADAAERAEEIDVARAQAARDRAQKRLANPNDPNVDWKRAQKAFERAQVRLQVAAKAGTASVAASGH